MRVGLAFGSMFIDCRIGKFVWSPSGKLSVFASVYPYFTFLSSPHLSLVAVSLIGVPLIAYCCF